MGQPKHKRNLLSLSWWRSRSRDPQEVRSTSCHCCLGVGLTPTPPRSTVKWQGTAQGGQARWRGSALSHLCGGRWHHGPALFTQWAVTHCSHQCEEAKRLLLPAPPSSSLLDQSHPPSPKGSSVTDVPGGPRSEQARLTGLAAAVTQPDRALRRASSTPAAEAAELMIPI